MYVVTTDEVSTSQVNALPTDARAHFDELRRVLQLAPCNGEPFNTRNPDGLLTMYFGPSSEGFVCYLILEDIRRVDIINVAWIDD